MIALQEELDWFVYRLYGLVDEDDRSLVWPMSEDAGNPAKGGGAPLGGPTGATGGPPPPAVTSPSRAGGAPPGGPAPSSGGPPPSAVSTQSQGRPLARPAKAEWRRKLPHIQEEGKTLFVTFCTHQRWVLPESVRDVVLRHCLHDDGVKLHMHAVVVMPDHVHLLFTPLLDEQGNTYGQTEILSGIKGASAHSVNKALGRTGIVSKRCEMPLSELTNRW